MSKFALTPSQSEAVHFRGRSLLVSAAAGSGKTRVLVERLMSYITDPENPRNIDEFLIITYTRAAASELRSRISKALGELAAEHPENKRLRRQQEMCCRAQIGTIHSFCTSILRENCHTLGIAPDFRVVEDDRGEAIRLNVLEKLLDDAYASIDIDEGFRLLTDTVGAGRDDSRLRNVILSLHTRLRSHPSPHAWADKQRAAMDMKDISDVADTVWGAYTADTVRVRAEYWAKVCSQLLGEMQIEPAVHKAYGPSLEETADALRDFSRALSVGWDEAAKRLPIPFPRLGSLRNSPDPALSDRVKARRESCKKAMGSIEKLMSADSSSLLSDLETVRPAMEALLDLTLRFDRAYSAEKRRRGLMDFSDLEHYALKLLTEGDDFTPTAAAKAISLRYAEIMVDEYQDVNRIQDLIFTSVSQNGQNLFMVGDVKQSIYRFRLADPTIFIEKYTAAEQGGDVRRVLLRENFRSRPCVINAANQVFESIMSKELGEIDYDENARLIAGASYPEDGEIPAVLTLLSVPEQDEDGDTPKKAELEAQMVAEQIKELVEGGAKVSDDGTFRPMRWSDIVILLRSPGSVGGIYRAALAKAGVPVTAEQGGGFFSSLEVTICISMLAVIDNPHQDIPLVSVLRSPVFGFTPDDLSEIRSRSPGADFFDALTAAADNMPKCRDFLELLSELRTVSADIPVSELLRHIYSRTDLPALCSVMNEGSARRNNLTELFKYAVKFESSGNRGLFRFVTYLRRMMEKGEEPVVGKSDSGNCVTITSIHRSKGLEYPVVFLADTGRKFNKMDLNEPVLIHPELGLGPMLTDVSRSVEYPTLARRAVWEKLNTETLSEEMRVLYVALTRAKERLYISCAVKDPEKLMEKLRQSLSMPMVPAVLSEAQCFAHWLIEAAMLGGNKGCLKLHITEPGCNSVKQETPSVAADDPDTADIELADEISRRLGFVYPYASALELPSKITATELKSPWESADEEARAFTAPTEYVFSMPDLGGFDARPLTGAEKGIALHTVMQRIDLTRTGSAQDVEGEIERLCSCGQLTDDEARSVDPKTVADFFASETGRIILDAKKIRREFRFSLMADAHSIYPDAPFGEILLQGIADCCADFGDHAVIIDYKTDRVFGDDVKKRAEHYKGQMLAYASAMERILKKPVTECILYFLAPGKAVSVPYSKIPSKK